MEASQMQDLPVKFDGATFDVRSNEVEIECLELDGEGIVQRLTYRADGESRHFSGDEIATAKTDDGTRATATLEDGAADQPIVHLTVIVPDVIFGDEHEIDVTAAALRTTHRSLFGGQRPGPQQSYEAFSLAGTACAPEPGAEQGTCTNWYAVHDKEPPGPAKLIVTGSCTFPTAGYEVELVRANPQGINPKDLLLNKVVHPPEGPVAQTVTEVQVRYEELTEFDYDTVTILPDGPQIEVVEAM
ncbi:MAG: hypothetical protein ACRDLS_00585 [Solirubrobacteraceae bacterium]